MEGSTELLQRLGERYGALLDEHRVIVRTAVADAGGAIVDTRGEEFLAAFPGAAEAARAAVAIQQAHAGSVFRVRIGMHTGQPLLSGEGYLGLDLHRAARICAAGHGCQILLSQPSSDLVVEFDARDLGSHRLHGIAEPERIFQLLAPGLPSSFPALRGAAEAVERLSRFTRRRRRTFEALGWDVRARTPGSDDELQTALLELAALLFDAARAAKDADRLIAPVDRRLLRRRLREHHELGTLSRHARERSAVIQEQLDALDAVVQRRRRLTEVAAGARDQLPLAAAIGLGERLGASVAALAEAVDRARPRLDTDTWRLRPTRYRGVYRAADWYVVPSVDESGVERVRPFRTLAEARVYRRAQHLREKTFSTSHEIDSYYRSKRLMDDGRAAGVRDTTGAGGGDGFG